MGEDDEEIIRKLQNEDEDFNKKYNKDQPGIDTENIRVNTGAVLEHIEMNIMKPRSSKSISLYNERTIEAKK